MTIAYCTIGNDVLNAFNFIKIILSKRSFHFQSTIWKLSGHIVFTQSDLCDNYVCIAIQDSIIE